MRAVVIMDWLFGFLHASCWLGRWLFALLALVPIVSFVRPVSGVWVFGYPLENCNITEKIFASIGYVLLAVLFSILCRLFPKVNPRTEAAPDLRPKDS